MLKQLLPGGFISVPPFGSVLPGGFVRIPGAGIKPVFAGGLIQAPISGAPLDHVADANARLSLDPTDPAHVPGFQVIQDADSGSGVGQVYTYNGPSSALTALFIDLGANEASGVYTKRGTTGGKDYYNLLGTADGTHTGISWDNLGGVLGVGWGIYSTEGHLLYYSLDDTTYPWQATTWVRSEGTGNANIVGDIFSMTAGEVVAGIENTNIDGGFPTTLLIRNGEANGRPSYSQLNPPATEIMSWDGTQWSGSGNTSSNDVGVPPSDATSWGKAPVNRNDIASLANWTPSL